MIEEEFISLEDEGLEFDATLKDNPIMVFAYGVYPAEKLLCADLLKKDIDEMRANPYAETQYEPYLTDLMQYYNDVSEDGEIIDLIIPFSALSEESKKEIEGILEELEEEDE